MSSDKPGLVCDQSKIEFKIVDSENDKRVQKQKARQAKIAQSRLVSTVTSSSVDTIKLYRENGQCVPFARAISGIPISGAAITNKPNTDVPHDGDVIITKESSVGHAAVIKEVKGDKVVLVERNFISGYVSSRVISWINNPKIKGFITKS